MLVALLVAAGGFRAAAQTDERADRIHRVMESAQRQTQTTTLYDPAYVTLAYPGGDVPPERGVCTDVVVRAYRAAGMDLQKLVHEDMKAHFSAYPKLWSLSRPDANIDHRRVPNLMTFFTRQGKSLPVTKVAADYQPGDVVSWTIPGALAHIGLVVEQFSTSDPERRLMVHNIGEGAKMEDVLFAFPITGHYRPL